jgi:hypothetical protein
MRAFIESFQPHLDAHDGARQDTDSGAEESEDGFDEIVFEQ